jgi:hypothetical protein
MIFEPQPHHIRIQATMVANPKALSAKKRPISSSMTFGGLPICRSVMDLVG